MVVKPKKHLGQHFLTDQNIAQKIVDSLIGDEYKHVLEVGPGTGALTKWLVEQKNWEVKCIEKDRDSVNHLSAVYPELNILEADFLRLDLGAHLNKPTAIIGNFPYNISSQILFKVYDHRNQIPEVVGMLQKEVAERIASPPGSKQYGILSVLLQAYYDIEYLFTVNETVFYPPPKVKSAVIRLRRNSTVQLGCNETLFKKVVKAGFNQRRKTLRNAIKTITNQPPETNLLTKRAEQLSVADFVELTQLLNQ